MEIIYVHHALRQIGNPPTQDDKIQPLGIKDAKITAKILNVMRSRTKSQFKAIYTSPYFRCAKTAEIINKSLNLPIIEDDRLNEYVMKNETWTECQLRIRESIKDIVDTYDDNDVVICVTSGVNITAFIGLAYKIPASENLPFPWVPSCSPIGFKIDKSCF